MSSFHRYRDLVAIPTANQLEELRAAAKLLVESVDLGMVADPGKRFDLRFTFDDNELNKHPVGALMIYEPVNNEGLLHGEIMLNILYPNLPILFVHEIAHYYDLFCFEPFGKFSSHSDKHFSDWRAAVSRTKAFRDHAAALSALSGARGVESFDPISSECEVPPTTISKDALSWLYVEAFARCFCQWIVRKWQQVATDEIHTLVDYFNKESRSEEARLLSMYWTDDEMISLGKALEELFKGAASAART